MHSVAPTLLSHMKLYLRAENGSWCNLVLAQEGPTSQFGLNQNEILDKTICLESHRQLLRSSLCGNSRFSISSVLRGMLCYQQKISLKFSYPFSHLLKSIIPEKLLY